MFTSRFASICMILARFFAPTYRSNRVAVGRGTRPINLIQLPQFNEQCLVWLSPGTDCLPVSQPPPTRHAAISCGSISQEMPPFRTKKIPVSTILSLIGGRPLRDLDLRLGINGSISLHNSSDTNGSEILESSLNLRAIQSQALFYLTIQRDRVHQISLGALSSTFAV